MPDLRAALEREQLECNRLAGRCDELERVLAAARVGFCRLDTAGCVLAASGQFKAEFGWPPESSPDWGQLQEHVPRADREWLAAALTAALERDEQLDVVVHVHARGHVQAVALRGRAARNCRSQAELLLTSQRLSDEHATTGHEREYQAAIEHERSLRNDAQNANRAKDEFLSLISHELRSPLNAILGWNRILALKRAEDTEVASITTRIEQSAKAQLQMVNDLLDVARIGTGRMKIEPRPLRFTEVVADAVELARAAARAKGIEIRSHMTSDGARLRGDPERLRQVVGNLLSNAVKFSTAGGTITVSVERLGEIVELRVSDTGKGIAPERLAQLFDHSQQGGSARPAHAAGLGLGLTLVREIVALHGGSVSAHSAGLGTGASFIVRLPAGDGGAAGVSLQEDAEAGADERRDLRGLCVLVVDDEPDARTLVAETLRMEGARVVTTDSAGAALRHLQAAGAHFDIVVTDIGMPEEDGYSLVRKLRSMGNGRRTLAIAVTGYTSSEDVEAAMDAGFDLHVPKPVDRSTFVPMVRRLASEFD
jgi:signal transduction histidine kinase/ActR/RegA family two-component response regulator